MKFWRMFSGLLAALCLWVACSTDMDLNAPSKDIPVIYGLLEMHADTQFIKINRAFLSEGPAEEAASEFDSLHYDNVSAVLSIPATGAKIALQSTLRHDKAAGTFSNPTYKLYYTTRPVFSNNKYKLTVTTQEPGESAMAFTDVVGDFSITSPAYFDTLGHTSGIDVGGINIRNGYTVRWKAAPNARIYSLDIMLHYRESRIGTGGTLGETDKKTVSWTVFREFTVPEDVSPGEDIEHNIPSDLLLSAFRERVQRNATWDNAVRHICAFEFVFFAGGEELTKYIRAIRAGSGSIAQTQQDVSYSNISGGEGIFSSRLKKVRDNLKAHETTLDSFAYSSITGPEGSDLRFQPCDCTDKNDSPNAAGEYCD